MHLFGSSNCFVEAFRCIRLRLSRVNDFHEDMVDYNAAPCQAFYST